MKILILSNFASGLERFRSMLISEFIKKGDSVVVVLPYSQNQNEDSAEQKLRELGCDLKHIVLDRRSINPTKDFSIIKNYMRILGEESPDLVITYTIKPNIYGGIACRRRHIPYAANITGLGTAFQKGKILRTVVIFLYKYALKKAGVVFFENSENRAELLKYGIVREEQACLLHGAGVDLEKFSYVGYNQNDDPFEFLFIGRIMKEKGIGELFVAMQKLIAEGENCSLTIVGDFEEDYTEKIKLYEVEGWLKYAGFQEDVVPFIKRCHCFVLPSWHEGMANTILEAASCGRPVIASNISGCKEAIISGQSGLFCRPRDSESLFEAMKKMQSITMEEREKMGRCGRQHMETTFDKRKVVEDTLKRLKQI